jgi:hypothetical protein
MSANNCKFSWVLLRLGQQCNLDSAQPTVSTDPSTDNPNYSRKIQRWALAERSSTYRTQPMLL